MNKIEKAITYFEALLERLGNGDSDNAVCATALAALREKDEREKGCECCNGSKPSKLGAKFYVWQVFYTEVGDGAPHYVRATNCPMCGRRLEVQDG